MTPATMNGALWVDDALGYSPHVQLREDRVPALDGIRGLAIGLVVFHHYLSQNWSTSAGSIAAYLQRGLWLSSSGVDLFFVLSGFLIGGKLLDTRASDDYYSRFYIRRSFRILPLYGTWCLLFVIGVTWYQERFPELFTSHSPLWGYVTFTQNVTGLFSGGPAMGAGFMLVTWSLAVEEQFYILLPALVRQVRGLGLARVCIGAMLFAPLARLIVFSVFPERLRWDAIYMLFPTRMDALFAGVLVAWQVRSGRSSKMSLVPWLAIGIGAIVAIASLSSSAPTAVALALRYSAYVAVYISVLTLALRPSGIMLAVASQPWLRSLGHVAYGVYLIHVPALHLCFAILRGAAPQLRSWLDVGAVIMALLVTISLARISWLFFEKPLIDVAARWTAPRPSSEGRLLQRAI